MDGKKGGAERETGKDYLQDKRTEERGYKANPPGKNPSQDQQKFVHSRPRAPEKMASDGQGPVHVEKVKKEGSQDRQKHRKRTTRKGIKAKKGAGWSGKKRSHTSKNPAPGA